MQCLCQLRVRMRQQAKRVARWSSAFTWAIHGVGHAWRTRPGCRWASLMLKETIESQGKPRAGGHERRRAGAVQLGRAALRLWSAPTCCKPQPCRRRVRERDSSHHSSERGFGCKLKISGPAVDLLLRYRSGRMGRKQELRPAVSYYLSLQRAGPSCPRVWSLGPWITAPSKDLVAAIKKAGRMNDPR